MFSGRIIQGRSYTDLSPGEPLWVSRQKLFASVCLMKPFKWMKNSRMFVCFIKRLELKLWWFCLTDLFVLGMFFHSANLLHFLSLSPTTLEPGDVQVCRESWNCSVKHGQWAEEWVLWRVSPWKFVSDGVCGSYHWHLSVVLNKSGAEIPMIYPCLWGRRARPT